MECFRIDFKPAKLYQGQQTSHHRECREHGEIGQVIGLRVNILEMEGLEG
jgi:hypothetical protein